MFVAVFRDLDPADEFHDEVWATGFGRTCIKHLGDAGVVHQRQCLPLGFKPGDHALRVHSRLDDFQSNPPADRGLLFSHVNHSVSTLTYLLEQLVMANAVAGFFADSPGATLRRFFRWSWNITHDLSRPPRCYGSWELLLVLDAGWIKAVASSNEIRARSQATHESPKSTRSSDGEMFGVNDSPLSNITRVTSFWPSFQCAMARMA